MGVMVGYDAVQQPESAYNVSHKQFSESFGAESCHGWGKRIVLCEPIYYYMNCIEAIRPG